MPPRSRRRAAQQASSRQEESFDDENFEDDLDGTVDLSELSGAGNDVDFESEVADYDDDVDFESMVDGGGDVDFAEDDVDFEDEEPVPARGGRASARSKREATGSQRGRSARSERLSGVSERKKAAKSARKEAKSKRVLSPEEIEARRRSRNGGILLALLMVAIIGAGIGFYYVVLRVPPQRVEALDHLRNATLKKSSLELLIGGRNADQAEALINSVVSEHLALEMFNFASVPDPDPDNPLIIDVKLARQAFDLKNEFESRLPEVQRIREDNQAKANADVLLARLSDVSPESEPDLGLLREAVGAFMANPAYPEKNADVNIAARYRTQYILPVKNMVTQIEREAARRISAGTTDVLAAANRETDLLMRQSRYGDALRLIDELSRNEQAASLGPVREKVLNSARKAWETDKGRATNNYRVATDPGSAPEERDAARQRSRDILQHVINRYGEGIEGVDSYVQEARRMQREYGF